MEQLDKSHPDGVIELDSEFGKELGFTSDKFDGRLWKKDSYIHICFIMSKHQGKGNLSKLFDKILSLGYGIKVPTPLAKMKVILLTHGFKPTVEFSKEMGYVEVWVKEVRDHV